MYEDIKKQFSDLEMQLADTKVLSDIKKIKEIGKKHANLKKAIELIFELEKIEKAILENEEMLDNEKDEELKIMIKTELLSLKERFPVLKEKIEEEINPADPNDKKDIIMEIRGGAGGDESALFAADLFRMYSRYCEKKGWKIDLINSNRNNTGGFKELIFGVHGKNVYGHLKYEAGTHRVQRVPETEKQGRVHTSTATVVTMPEAEEVDIEIKPQDIRIDVFCSSGPGGQNVNKVETAVRITHLSTGITVSSQDQKSQQQNKDKGLQILRSRLLAKQEEERIAKESAARKNQIGAGDRSDKIRTYNFPQDRLTDHRLGQSWSNLNIIMDGNLDEIIRMLKTKKI